MRRSPFARLDNAPEPFGSDPWLAPYRDHLAWRASQVADTEKRLTGGKVSLCDFASAHEFFGLHRVKDGWVFREWAPNATRIYLVGDFSQWKEQPEFELHSIGDGNWELSVTEKSISHGMHYMMHVEWDGGKGERVPAYARYVVQDPDTNQFSAVVWNPEHPYVFRNPSPARPEAMLVYETHVGMAQEEAKVGTFEEFRTKTLPRIAASGYNTIQLMAVMSHPYYGSFGYHVANFFSISGRFGTPDEFKALVDEAHRLGLRVIMDIVHSHAVKNETEGIAKIDGTRHAYFHGGDRGLHRTWDSLCFDYGKTEVLHFLLSNCRYYLDEYHLDGFRFDGVTSMLYFHHGIGKAFSGYADYFGPDVDEDAVVYLSLANRVIHAVRPDAVSVAEDVSGMPGLAAPSEQGGIGFDYRMAMGVTDMWFKMFDKRDEDWSMFGVFCELTNRRADERSISYVECHDQAIVGGKTAMFTLADRAMYDAMDTRSSDPMVDRAVALHKMIRLATAAAAGHGYLNFMGNACGHPEWIDFPRADNGWSYDHARRIWSISDDPGLRYIGLRDFDRAMLSIVSRKPGFYATRVQTLRIDEMAKVIVFERDGLFFCFNFNCNASYPDYEFETRRGCYHAVLDTDSTVFGGFGRRSSELEWTTERRISGDFLKIYLPCRTAIVLERRPLPEN
ncbi:MAG: alpha amylase C-terminal domain-containing protein [Victivallaceae bacterium]|nr:alpha amylase C-terminal domain-containing protein [Victivallaceae bacterium]